MTIPDPHMAAVTAEMILELKFVIIPQPAYSVDLASSNHQIFQPLERCYMDTNMQVMTGQRCIPYLTLHTEKTISVDGTTKILDQSNKYE
jgi:hypothetical protein